MATAVINQKSKAAGTGRLLSLDVLRGITISFMILVNNGMVHPYWPLEHSAWNGWTPTDLVFPTFLFLVGITIVFSFESRLNRGVSKASLVLHTIRRAVILFLLGLVVNGFPYFHLATLRIYGVLPRIAICFLLASLLYFWDRGVKSKIVLIVAALLGYWAIMRLVPVPGYGVPGRDIPFLDPNANMVAYLDRHIFPGRLYEKVRDPEGFLSTLPALATTLLGTVTGIWLRTKRSESRKARGMLVCGILGLALGLIWNHWFPINKKLWTSSYVLLAAGWTLLGLSFCYWAIEIKKWTRNWTYFWLVFGMNAITAYVFSELLAATLSSIHVHVGTAKLNLSQIFFYKVLAGLPSVSFASLIYSLCFVLVCFIPMAVLYHKKIFLKV